MNEPAVVLAAFGVSIPQAINGILNILELTKKAIPGSEVKLAFTSNQIRKIWRKRAQDDAWLREHPGMPEEILNVQGVLATVANLQDAGHKDILVQSLHVYAGEEYRDLESYINGLLSIHTAKPRWMPFDRLVLGRPALGKPGPAHPYQKDLKRAAEALKRDAERALKSDAVLLYAGHGNPYFSTGVYTELELVMRKMYPGLKIMIGVVEGSMGVDYISRRLSHTSAEKVILKPLMVVAGEHARKDICGGNGSWREALSQAGFKVECLLEGLGENNDWAELYVQNARQALEG